MTNYTDQDTERARQAERSSVGTPTQNLGPLPGQPGAGAAQRGAQQPAGAGADRYRHACLARLSAR